MQTGAITGYIDVAQLTLYAFWLFFAGLIFYLRREDKREGYPLVSDRSDHVMVQGFPAMPSPKTFLLRQGLTYQAPPGNVETREIAAEPFERFLGAPLHPTGVNPLVDAVGPGSYALRDEVPEVTAEGQTRVAPIRVATDYSVAPGDPDPRGMIVLGADRKVAGTVTDFWVDRSEPAIRYFEVEVAAGGRQVLVPINFTRIDGEAREIKVDALLAAQFSDIPDRAKPDEITAREEDKVLGYFGGGTLYATPQRSEPVL